MRYKQILTLFLILIPGFIFGGTKHGNTSAFTTLNGKILCGYQGWFAALNDGSNLNWKHYEITVNGTKRFEPGACSIDFWPDMREYDTDEQYETAFTLPDGSPATVYSAYNSKSVIRHFRWMQEYGIDGIILQRFATNTRYSSSSEKRKRDFNDKVMRNCFAGAEQYGRTICLMYDMSGMKENDLNNIKNDWKHLIDDLKITNRGENQTYLFHKGKPLICLWGVGFDDGRHDPAESSYYSMQTIDQLIDFFKNDPEYGGCSVLLGVNFTFRTKTGKSYIDDYLHNIIRKADIVQPWLVGRLKTINDVTGKYAESVMIDQLWCESNGVEYMPCAFPGFSWYNMKIREKEHIPTPRLGGEFIWRQFYTAIQKGAKQIYANMFDEIDEGTALFKCTNTPPNDIEGNNTPIIAHTGDFGPSRFQTYEGLESDHYLWLVGEATRMLKKEISASTILPKRATSTTFPVDINMSVLGNDLSISYSGNLPEGYKIYMSPSYVIPYGAPSLGKPRDPLYFPTEIVTNGISIDKGNAAYYTFISVDENDKVTGYRYEKLDTSASIIGTSSEKTIKISYNRSQQSLIIISEQSHNPISICIYTVNGSLIDNARLTANKISTYNLRKLSKGLYIVKVQSDKEYYTTKINLD
ncbi:T9SS type A sorting domain-containing protein [Coprobacter sp.]